MSAGNNRGLFNNLELTVFDQEPPDQDSDSRVLGPRRDHLDQELQEELPRRRRLQRHLRRLDAVGRVSVVHHGS